MPRRFNRYRKNYRRRRVGGKKSTWSKWAGRARTAAGMAIAAYRGVNYIRGLVNAELFKYDYGISADISSTGQMYPLHAIAQGDTDVTRTGNSLFVRSVNIKGILYRTALGDPTQFIRMSVIIDTQQIGDTSPAYTDVYEGNATYSHLNSNTVGRFKVLYNRILSLDTVKSLSIPIEINLAMRHHIRFNGAANTDVQKGGIYLCLASSQGTSNYPHLEAESRLSYHDN